MAISNEQLRNEIQTSVHGRRLGIDPNDYLVGPKDLRKAVTAATSGTTAVTIPNYGFTTVQSATANKTWSMAAPEAGVEKKLVATTTSTRTMKITLASGSLLSTSASSATSITFNGRGDACVLVGLSTSQYAVVGRAGTVTTT